MGSTGVLCTSLKQSLWPMEGGTTIGSVWASVGTPPKGDKKLGVFRMKTAFKATEMNIFTQAENLEKSPAPLGKLQCDHRHCVYLSTVVSCSYILIYVHTLCFVNIQEISSCVSSYTFACFTYQYVPEKFPCLESPSSGLPWSVSLKN